MKFVLLLALAVIGFRLLLGRWPWEPRGKFVRSGAKAQARALLGVPEGASRENIIDAHRRLIVQVHPDRGGNSELVHEANAARDLLLGALAGGSTESS